VVTGITLTALAAAASSVNVMLLGYSRDLVALAKSRVLPAVFEKVTGKEQQPVYSILLMVCLALGTVIIGGKISDLATLIVIALLVFQIVLGVAALLIPRKMATQYKKSGFRLGTIMLPFFCGGLIILSLALLLTASVGSPGTALIGGSFILTGVLYYFLRRDALANKDIYIEDRILAEVNTINSE
jgi:APA family basic amino acid/polyamine antiporter